MLHLVLESAIQISRWLCELGRLPVFDVPKIVSLTPDDQQTKSYFLEIELLQIPFVAQSAYQIVIWAASELCRWMARNSPNLEKKLKAFETISEKVVKPLHQLVPGGKSTIPVLKVAHALGIPFTHLAAGVYQLGWGSKARRLDRSTSELDSVMGAKFAQNKVFTANLLRMAGLPSATHIVVSNQDEAIVAADRLEFPLVVKPVDCDRGEGVYVDLDSHQAIKEAFTRAHALSKSKQVVVERQVPGVCHRLFIVNWRLLYAVKRLPMSVRGDGQRTAKQLVDDEVAFQQTRAPWFRSEIQPIDERAITALSQVGLTAESTPEEGTLVPLRAIESTADGGVDEDVTQSVHAENITTAITAAKLFGLHIVGIDIISPDISKPWHQNGAIINEVNFAPLLGGGEISRSHLPRFLTDYIEGDGKIPIEIFDDEGDAVAKQLGYGAQGLRCYFTTSARTTDPAGNLLMMPFDDLRQRLRALVLRPDVDAVVVCIQPV